MGPVLEAIEAGHFERTIDGGRVICRVCLDDFPCQVIRDAQRRQAAYGEWLLAEQRLKARGELHQRRGAFDGHGR